MMGVLALPVLIITTVMDLMRRMDPSEMKRLEARAQAERLIVMAR